MDEAGHGGVGEEEYHSCLCRWSAHSLWGHKAWLKKETEIIARKETEMKKEAGKFSKDLMVMNPDDNVAVCLRELKAGEEVNLSYNDKEHRIKIIAPIPLGHKVALKEVTKGQPIVKYGQIIGKAKSDITIGQHVHVHNVSDY